MFESDVSRDVASKRVARRLFLVGGGTIAAGLAVLGFRHSSVVEAAVHGTPGEVTIVNFSADGKNLGKVTVAKVVKTDGEWRQQLGNNSFGIAAG